MRKLALAAVLLTFALFVATVVYDRRLRHTDPVGYRNLKTCARLRPGLGEGELRAALGEPTRRTPGASGELLEFHTLQVAAAPIRAVIDGATKKVAALWCRDDDQPTWRFPGP